MPKVTTNGTTTRITYRTGPNAPTRTWDLVPSTPRAGPPMSVTALPDATVVAWFAFGFENAGRFLIVRLSSRGIARAVIFAPQMFNDAESVRADATGVYVLESQEPNGARLVRYRIDR